MSPSGPDLPEPIAKSSTQVLRLTGFLGDNQGIHRCQSSVRIRNPEIVIQRTYAEHLNAATSAYLRATVRKLLAPERSALAISASARLVGRDSLVAPLRRPVVCLVQPPSRDRPHGGAAGADRLTRALAVGKRPSSNAPRRTPARRGGGTPTNGHRK